MWKYIVLTRLDEVTKRLDSIEANQQLILNRLETLATQEHNDMADVKTNADKVEADLATIKAGIAGLNGQIQALNDKLNAGTILSPEDAASLDQLATDADALAATFPAPSSGNPPPPPPPPSV